MVSNSAEGCSQPLVERATRPVAMASVWLARTAFGPSGASAPTGILWMEVRSMADGPTVHDQGTFVPADGLYR